MTINQEGDRHDTDAANVIARFVKTKLPGHEAANLQETMAELLRTLAFYADFSAWRERPINRGIGIFMSPAMADSGQKARAARDKLLKEGR